MKKKFLLSAILISAFCLCGCNMQITFGTNSEQEGDSGQVNVSMNGSEEDEEFSNDNDTENVGQQSISGYLNVTTTRFYDYLYEDVSLMYGDYDLILLDAPEYPALTEAVETFNNNHGKSCQAVMDELKTWADEDYAYEPEGFMGPYYNEEDMYITRADNKTLSVLMVNSWYGGGAHDTTSFKSVNFDTQTGRELALEDVIVDTNALPSVLTTELLEQYPYFAESEWVADWNEHFASYLTPETENDATPYFTWTLGYEGVTFYFGAYELGAYSDGLQAVVVTYAEYPELFTAFYFENIVQDYVVEIPQLWWGEEGFTDLNGDGVMDMITLERNYNPEHEMYESVTINVNGVTYAQEVYGFEIESYLVKANGNTYLYLQRTSNSDYRDVYAYQITESSIDYVGNFAGSLTDITNSADFGLNRRFDLLSTTSGEGRCYVGADGMPVEKGGAYVISGETIITSTVEITAELVDENGNLLGESKTFPVGTEFTFDKTDGMTYVDMKTSEGSMCRLYTAPEWPPTVNGMDAESSFVMLWYAG